MQSRIALPVQLVLVGAALASACGDDGASVADDILLIGDVLGDVAADDVLDASDSVGADAIDAAPDASDLVPCVDNLDCRGGEVCRDGFCRGVCTDDSECSADGGVCGPDGTCVACLDDGDCDGVAICTDRACIAVECLADGDCSEGLICVENACEEPADPICTPGRQRCDANTLYECDSTGTAEIPTPCAIDEQCVGDDGSGFCEPIACEPFSLGCADTHTAYVCADDGVGFDAFVCREDQYCVDGVCAVVDCEPLVSFCEGDAVVTCGADGNVASTTPCAATGECAANPAGCDCRGNTCVVLTCVPDSSRCVGNSTQRCSSDGAGWLAPVACEEPYCVAGQCTNELCTPGTLSCDGEVMVDCPLGGGAPTRTNCAVIDQICEDGACVPPVCDAGTVSCVAGGTALLTCDSRGSSELITPCGDGTYCADGACVPQVCEPGATSCDGADVVTCTDLGDALEVSRTCTTGCTDGACNDPCEFYIGTNIGCSFFTADLPNYRLSCTTSTACGTGTCISGYCDNNADSLATRLFVTNEWSTTATVSLRSSTGTLLGTATLAAGTGTQELAFTGALWRTSRSSGLVITSDVPISVRQDASTNAATSYTSDGSLVLPELTLGTEYLVTSFPTITAAGSIFHSYFTVVGTQPSTNVTITFRSNTLAAASGTPPAVTAGSTRTYTIGRGEALQFATDAVVGADFTGTTISASAPVAVFAGNECGMVPIDVGYCDHLEEQLFPLDSATTQIAYARSFGRGTEPDVIRIMATEDDTSITTVPAIVGLNGIVLDAGQFVTAMPQGDVVINATAPIQGVAFLVGTGYGGTAIPSSPLCSTGSALGDPSLAAIPPIGSSARDIAFVVPSGYAASYVSVAARAGTSISLDAGASVSPAATVAGINFYRIPVTTAGRHVLRATGGVSAILVLYGCAYSSMMALGVDFR